MNVETTDRVLRGGIVGGGEGAFIGRVHRMAAELDGQARLVAGALSSNPERSRKSAREWFLERGYGSWQEMAAREAATAGIDFVIVATPNHLHFPVVAGFLEAGIHVVCDKPLTLEPRQAQQLVELARMQQRILAVTHTYAGYAAVIEARERVRAGELGTIRKVLVEYLQDWLMHPVERSGQKQAEWRTDPDRAGTGGCIADIGTHGQHLLEFVTGLKVRSLCADATAFVAGRTVNDDASILLRLDDGARGVLTCSQVACGEANDLAIRVYGTRAGLEWRQREAGTLTLKPAEGPSQRLEVGRPWLTVAARAATRLPAGHPEGYIEAFATLYRRIFEDIRRSFQRLPPQGGYPTGEDGVRGVQFITQAVASARDGGVWLDL